MGKRFMIEIEALEDPVPAANRLRQWLKIGFRGLRLRCKSVGPAAESADEGDDDGCPVGDPDCMGKNPAEPEIEIF